MVGAAAIERGDEADWRLAFDRSKGCEDMGQVVRSNADVGIAEDEVIEASVGHELGEVADFAVGAEDLRSVDEADGVVGEVGAELGDDCCGGVVETRNAEKDLVFAGIILAAVAGKGLPGSRPWSGFRMLTGGANPAGKRGRRRKERALQMAMR
jgi:hypothetical protein